MPSPDITAGTVFTPNQQNINAPIMNAIVGSAVINPSFVSSKPTSMGMASTDTLLMYSQSGSNLQQIPYSTVAAQVVGSTQNNAQNLLHNGDMAVNQYTGVPVAGNTITTIVDRWKFQSGGSTLLPALSQGNVGGVGNSISPNPTFYTYAKTVVSTTQASMAAGNFAILLQNIEGYDVLQALGGPISLSFIYNTNTAGTYSVSLRDGGVTKSYVTTFTAAGDSAWHLLTIPNIPQPPSSGTWNMASNSAGMSVNICLASGSSYQTGSLNSWISGNFLAGSGQVNMFNTASAYFYLTQACLNPGPTCAPFPALEFGNNLRTCLRYLFCPSALTGAGAYVAFISSSNTASGLSFPVPMRIAPSIISGTTWSVNSGSVGTPNGTATSSVWTAFGNTSNNWSPGAFLAIQSGGFTAEI